MVMDYKKWDNQLKELYSLYSQIGDDAKYERELPATTQEVEGLERELGCTIPESLRDSLLNFSRSISFSAFLKEDFSLPKELIEIFSAVFVISIDEILEAENSRKEWLEDCFPNPEDAYDKVWHNKLGLMTVGNGDIIAFDLNSESNDKPVVYLSHDDGEGHGYVLGKNFADYFEKLLMVGGCGNEDWQTILFRNNSLDGINPFCENAKTYRELINYKI